MTGGLGVLLGYQVVWAAVLLIAHLTMTLLILYFGTGPFSLAA